MLLSSLDVSSFFLILLVEGVGVLHKITMANLTHEDIVTQSGDIMWKLISIFGNIDQELAKLFADNKGQDAVIEILIAKQQGNGSIPYIRILNGLVQIPQLVSKMLDSGLAETVKIINDLYPNDIDVITMNFDTMKKISNQKVGRDFLIKRGLVDSILKNITQCANLKNSRAVLSGLTVLDNLSRNDSGKEAIKAANGIDCLSNVLDKFETDDAILKMCAKIYSKLATNDDMKKQLELLQKYYEDLSKNGCDSIKFSDVNKSLVLISNFMLVDEICKMLCEKDNLTLLENLFTEISKIPLENKSAEFVDAYLLTNKYFMIIFYRIFASKPEIYDKTTELGKEKAELIKKIQNSLGKIWESINAKISDNEATVNVFRSYWNSYNDIIYQNYKSITNSNDIDKDYINTLTYMIKNIIVNGKKYFDVKTRPNFIASRVLKTADLLSVKETELISSIESCYDYLLSLYNTSENNDTLSNVVDVLYDLLQRQPQFKDSHMEEIVLSASSFMLTKHKYRYPSLISMKIVDMFLTPEFLSVYLKTPDANNKKTHAVNYVNCVVSVMTDSFYVPSTMLKVVAPSTVGSGNEVVDDNVENEINELGTKMLSRLIDMLAFKTLTKAFKEQAESFQSMNATPESINALEQSMLNLYGLMNIKEYYTAGVEDVLAALKELIAKEVGNYEMYKKDKEKMKEKNYFEILSAMSHRIRTELALVSKINSIALANDDYDNASKSYDILFAFLSKSSDISNIKQILTLLNSKSQHLIDNEAEFTLEKKEIITEKIVNVGVLLMRRLVEEEEGIRAVIQSMIKFCTLKSSLCNILVKGGVPRILLQLMETTPNVKTAELALELLKIIAFSNNENLTMVANQNVLLKFYEFRAKYAGNDNITTNCDLISNEIMKLPGQEKYAEDVVNEAINEFNENCKLDYKQPETKAKLLGNIEVINAFSTNKKQIELLLQGEFVNNLNTVFDKTIEDNEVSQVNEKLLNNELSILSKIKANTEYDNEIIVKKLLSIIKNKSNYNEIFLSSARMFSSYLKDEDLYNKHLADKLNTDFIDLLFDISDNYLDDAKVSKELNNIMCYLCLRNEKFADYIKQRGGLANVLEDLKANVSNNDAQSQQMKLNSMKMLNSLCADENGIDMFIKADGIALVNNVIKNEMELLNINEDDECDAYTTNETIQFNIKNICDRRNEDYFLYCVKIVKSGVEKGRKVFIDDKQYRNIIKIADKKYADVNLIKEICEIYKNSNVTMPESDKDKAMMTKVLLSIKAKIMNSTCCCDKEVLTSIDTVCEKINSINEEGLKKSIEDNKKIDNTSNEEENTKVDMTKQNKAITYLSLLSSQNDKFKSIAENNFTSIKELYDIVNGVYLDKSKPLNDSLDEGSVISMLTLAIFLLNKDKKAINTTDCVDDFLFLGFNFYEIENAPFITVFLNKFNTLLDILGKHKEDKTVTQNYLNYLQNINSKSLDLLEAIHNNIKANNDYSSMPQSQKDLLKKTIEDTIAYYEINDDKDIKDGYAKRLTGLLCDLTEDTFSLTNIDDKERVALLLSLWHAQRFAICNTDNNEAVTDEAVITSLFTLLNKTYHYKDYSDTNNDFGAIVNTICSKTENNNTVFEKLISYISGNLNGNLNENVKSLAALSKFSVAVKLMLKNKDMMKKLREVYSDETISQDQRKDLCTIYGNVMKNSYNIDTILSDDPETFKVLAKRVSSTTSAKLNKDNNDVDIASTELDNVNSIMKDGNNYEVMTKKELIIESDLQNAIVNYKDYNKEVDPKLEEMQKIINDHRTLKREQTNYQIDEAILANLKKRIESAFDHHIDEVEKATPSSSETESASTEVTTEKVEKTSKELGFVRQMSLMVPTSVLQKASSAKKGRLSIVSRNLFYNENNSTIVSPISIKTNEDMASALDSLLALIRLLYNNNKTSTDTEIKKKRETLLLEALRLLKMMSICPDNHKPIMDLGLVSFMERITDDSKDKTDNFLIYIACLDILKNCTWTEGAVLLLLESPLLDKLIEEVLVLYTKPEELLKNDELKSAFLYDNINFSNMCKCPKGFDVIFKKIGIDKLRELGVRTGNVDFLAAIIEMLINYINNNSEQELKEDLINDIVTICDKGLSLPDKTESLFAKALKLLGMVYRNSIIDRVKTMNVDKKVNEVFDLYKTEPDFIMNSVHTLAVISLENNEISSNIVDSKLLDKIITEVMSSDLNNDLVENMSLLYKNLLVNNVDNQKKMCKDEIINNIIFFIQRYQKKCKQTLRSCATMNPALLNEKIMYSEAAPVTMDKFSIENRILINLITALDLLTSNDGSVELIAKSKFLATLLDTIDKPTTDIEIVKVSLNCMGNYFVRNSSDYWQHYEIEQLYNILKALEKQYYANSDILTSICKISGYILKGFDSKLYTEKFYLLCIESLNCQDWNLPLVLLTLQIIKESLIQHEDLKNDVFETTKQTVFNLLRLYYNTYTVQVLGFDILSLFNANNIHMYFITNDIVTILRESLDNEEFNSDPVAKLAIRKSIYNLASVLCIDEGNTKRISFEIMEVLLKEVDYDYSDSLVVSEKIIRMLLNFKCSMEPFIEYSGLETMMNLLNKNQDHPDALLIAFDIIAFVVHSNEENKKKVQDYKFVDVINVLMEKNKDNKKIQFEGKSLKYLIENVKGQKSGKPYQEINFPEITAEKLVKTKVKTFLTNGKIVKVVTPKGKVKEMQLMFSQDLLKVYCKKLKTNLPPKPKYVIETCQIVKATKGHGTEVFKKTKGLFKSAPKAELCFSIIGVKDKSINVECDSEAEVDHWVKSVELIAEYMKKTLS